LNGDLELTPFGKRTRLRLRVNPGAKKTTIVGAHGGALKISVAAPPERGKANRAVVELLARVLGLTRSSVVIAAGEVSEDKVVLIPLSPAEIRSRLAAARS
jgi:uncharacterized protein (TIGR00251 family)